MLFQDRVPKRYSRVQSNSRSSTTDWDPLQDCTSSVSPFNSQAALLPVQKPRSYYAENLTSSQNIYPEYKQLNPLLDKDEQNSDRVALMDLDNPKTEICMTQFQKEKAPKASKFSYATQVRSCVIVIARARSRKLKY